ncbi:16931_t:CDS:1, partial [Racocetra fulgida]
MTFDFLGDIQNMNIPQEAWPLIGMVALLVVFVLLILMILTLWLWG